MKNSRLDDAAYHSLLIDRFLDAEDGSETARSGAQAHIDYYDGKQWTDEEVRELKKRGQPAITWNLTRQKIDYLQGLERTQRTRPRALPRTPLHEADSTAATDALHYVYDDTRYEEVRSRVWGDILKAGWGGLEITAEPRAGEGGGAGNLGMRMGLMPGTPDISIIARRCAWDRMFWDPYSSEDDFADAAYLGLVIWMDRDAAIREFGEGAAEVFDETVSLGSIGGTFDDKPKAQSWVSGAGQRRRVRVVQMYYIADDGEWDYAYFTKGGILMSGPSPWVDENGRREHPFCWRAAYVDRDNNRYGPIRDMVDLQDEVNKRRSKALHHFTARQTYGNQKFAANAAENKRQLARPDGHVTMQGEAEFGRDFGIIPTSDQAQGHFQLLAQASAAFETVGPNASMLGKKDAVESGRAILAQQQGGVIQMGTLTDALRQMDMGAYRKIWNRVRQYWSGEMWIRVTDNEQNLRFVGLNGAPQLDPRTGMVMPGPPVAALDVDIILDDAPTGIALMDEQFALLVQLKQFDANNELPLKTLIAAAPNLRAKQELLRGMEEAGQAPPDPLMVAGAQAELAEKQAEAQFKQSAALRNLAEAQRVQAELALMGVPVAPMQATPPQVAPMGPGPGPIGAGPIGGGPMPMGPMQGPPMEPQPGPMGLMPGAPAGAMPGVPAAMASGMPAGMVPHAPPGMAPEAAPGPPVY
jgi:hypothetical protein